MQPAFGWLSYLLGKSYVTVQRGRKTKSPAQAVVNNRALAQTSRLTWVLRCVLQLSGWMDEEGESRLRELSAAEWGPDSPEKSYRHFKEFFIQATVGSRGVSWMCLSYLCSTGPAPGLGQIARMTPRPCRAKASQLSPCFGSKQPGFTENLPETVAWGMISEREGARSRC